MKKMVAVVCILSLTFAIAGCSSSNRMNTVVNSSLRFTIVANECHDQQCYEVLKDNKTGVCFLAQHKGGVTEMSKCE